jgi:hypothetical protein
LQSTNNPPAVSSNGDISSAGDELPDFTYLVRQYRGSTYIMAANNLNSARAGTFTIQGQWPTNTLVNLLTENRVIPPQLSVPGSLTFSDSFDPYKIHLYEIIPAPTQPQVGYWRFEESSGPVAFDSVPSPAEDGILLGNARRNITTPNTTIPQTGAANQHSVEFFATDGDAVDIDQGPLLDVGTGDFTLEAWLYARTIPGGIAMIAGKRISGLFGDKGYELLAQSSASGFVISFSIRAGGPQATLTTGLLGLGNWCHVAAVRSSNPARLNLYINGGLVQSIDDPLTGVNLNSTQHLTIGGCIEGDGAFHRPFDGFIDEARLSRSALAPSAFLNSPKTRPVLAFTRTTGQMTLSWTGVGFALQSNTNPATPAGWVDVPNGQTTPTTISLTSTNQFYRLIAR